MDRASAKSIERRAATPVPPFAVPTYIRPVPTAFGQHQIAGGLARFSEVDVVMSSRRGYTACRMTCDQLLSDADDRHAASVVLDRIIAPRPLFAGLDMTKTHIMGVLNVTPDSFSDGGQNLAAVTAIAAGKAMRDAGATIIDIGGESTRPGADPVTQNQELARILPPITGLARDGVTISVDTRHADVMRRATKAGAAIINDIEALQGDGTLGVAAQCNAPVVLMHMQGTPQTMQDSPSYAFAPVDIYRFLQQRVEAAVAAGIPRASLAIDPGFGFGKTVWHNLQLVNWLALLHGLGVVVLFGASRKSTIAKISRNEPADRRLPGSLGLALAARRQGAQIIRVHDVAETAQALAVEEALLTADD
ncbi:MAG: dihydropteroate synthase [Candidatus Puniceispirillum sp.]